MRGRRPIAAILILVLVAGATAVLAAGCWDLRELDDYAIVGLVAIDKGREPGWLRVSALVQHPGAPVAGGGRASPVCVLVSGEGPTFSAANRSLEQMSSKYLTYSHAQGVIIGEELARDSLEPVADALARSREFHRSMVMVVADGTTGEEVLASVRGELEESPATYIAHLVEKVHREYGESSYMRVHDFLVTRVAHGQEVVLPLIKLVPKPPAAKPPGEGGSAGGGASGGGQSAPAAEPAAPVERRAEATGLALFDGSRLMVKTTGEQAMAINLVRGQFTRGLVTVNGVATRGADLTVQIFRYSRQITVERDGPSVDVKIRIRLKALIEDIAASEIIIDPEGLSGVKRLIASRLSDMMTEVVKFAQTEVRGDVFDFQLHARRTFRTWWEWADFNWGLAFVEAKVTIGVEVTEIRPGLSAQVEAETP